MLISYHWLKKFTPLKITPKEIAKKITLNLVEVESLIKRGKDTIFEIENKGITNRPDCFSHLGMTREVVAYFKLPLKDPFKKLKEKKFPVERDLSLKVKIMNPDLCPRYCAIILTDLKVSPSPKWLKVGVENCGIRSINNVVDITNYVMLELGQPLHAFDYDKIEGKEIIVRKARKNEEITTLDGVQRKLNKNILVIADNQKPIGIAGIMGGKNTEVTGDSKTIVLESANFNQTNNRLSSKFLKLRTEASTRFEKGQDLNLPYPALIRAVELLKQLIGAKIASKVFDLQSKKIKPWQIKVRSSWINKFLGIKLSANRIKSILERLQLKTEIINDMLIVTIPTYRPDLTMEADIAEEVARIYGYDKIPVSLPKGEMKPTKSNQKIFLEKEIKKLLVNLGFTEIYTYPLVGKKLIEKTGLKIDDHLKLLNPLTVERTYFRTSLVLSALETLAKNQTFFEKIKIFEIAEVFLKKPKREIKETPMLLGLINGEKIYQAKGIVEVLLRGVGINMVTLEHAIAYPKVPMSLWHSGRTAVITLEGEGDSRLGIIGEVHPSVLKKFEIEGRVTAFELNFEEILRHASLIKTYTPIPKYPPIIEDLAFVLPERALVGKIMAEIKRVSKLICGVELLDAYQKTRTFRINYQHPRKSLTDEEVQGVRKKIIKKLEKKFKAKLKNTI